MKYLYVFILSLLLTNGFSQVWIDSSAKWTFDYWNVSEGGTYIWEYTNDTLIDGKVSQIISTTKYVYYSGQNGPVYGGEISGGKYYTTVSNDSVFYYKNGQFFLLYDFGASIGDTWMISIDTTEFACQDTAIVEVTDTGSIFINGATLRTLTLQTNTNSFNAMSGTITERFGSPSGANFGFLPGYQYCPGGSIYEFDILTFRCYEDYSFPTYNPSGKNCDTLTVVNEFGINNFNIYPNPTSNYLIVDLPINYINKIEIIDLNGRLINTFRKEGSIDISKLDNGMYFIRINTSDRNIITKPFIKE